mmetsp:Transcript_7945/g.9442  ORF Transcript_7945/g.9442 Transcript_7945/m.9442 type:complete len:97 (+) Transcript_7945:332-622(+)
MPLASLLVSHSRKDFVNVAVKIATNPTLAASLKDELQHRLVLNEQHEQGPALDTKMASPPLFDSVRYTRNLERGFQAMWEVYSQQYFPMHLIISQF